jgi:hypothetical protein
MSAVRKDPELVRAESRARRAKKLGWVVIPSAHDDGWRVQAADRAVFRGTVEQIDQFLAQKEREARS